LNPSAAPRRCANPTMRTAPAPSASDSNPHALRSIHATILVLQAIAFVPDRSPAATCSSFFHKKQKKASKKLNKPEMRHARGHAGSGHDRVLDDRLWNLRRRVHRMATTLVVVFEASFALLLLSE